MTEQTVTIFPARRSIIPGATARATRNALVRFTSSSSRHSASVNCSSGLRSVMPAFETSTSTRPSARDARGDRVLVGDVERRRDRALDLGRARLARLVPCGR